MFSCCKMEGVSVVLAPLGAELGSAVGEGGFALVCNRMTVAAGRASPSKVMILMMSAKLSLRTTHSSLRV